MAQYVQFKTSDGEIVLVEAEVTVVAPLSARFETNKAMETLYVSMELCCSLLGIGNLRRDAEDSDGSSVWKAILSMT